MCLSHVFIIADCFADEVDGSDVTVGICYSEKTQL